MIFAILVAMLLLARSLAELVRKKRTRFNRIVQIAFRFLAVAVVALVLAAPRLNKVREAMPGRYLNRLVLEAPAAARKTFDRPTLSGFGILQSGFDTRRRAIVSLLALAGVALTAVRRREAVWFVVGWVVVTLVMNPSFIGSERVGLIDEMHWRLAVESAVAAMAGLTIGFVSEHMAKARSIAWNSLLALVAAGLCIRGTVGLHPVPDACRYVLPEDLQVMKWIEQNVPDGDRIAGRGFPEHGEILGRDAMMWLPHFTRHLTNHTNLAAGLEKGPVDSRRKLRDFTRELYNRDMSTPESARWMREEGFRWFFVGAIEPDKDAKLLEQLANNPGLEVVEADGAARLYRVR